MAINTDSIPGEQQRVFAEAPALPSSLAKGIDVAAIYDRVKQGLDQSTEISQAGRQALVGNQAAATATAEGPAIRSTIPGQVAATNATNAGVVAQTPLTTGILSRKLQVANETTPGEIAATNAKNNEAKLNSDLNSIYTKSGLTYGPEQADQTNQAKGRLLQKISESPTGVVNEPIVGPNGTPIGSMLGYVGPNGPEFHAVPIPFGQMARINTGVKYQPIGTVNDPVTGQPQFDQYQTIYTNAAGGINKGQLIHIQHGQPPPGELYQDQGGGPNGPLPVSGAPDASGGAGGSPGQTNAAPSGGNGAPGPAALPDASSIGTSVPGGRLGQEFQVKQAEERAKMRTTALEAISASRDQLAKNSFAIGKLASDLKDEQTSALGSGPITGGVLAAFRPTARAVNSDLSNFVGQVMSSARNIRTQREFYAFTNAIPSAADQPQVQNAKLAYLEASNNTLNQRNEYKEQLLRSNPNIDPDQADQAAVSKFPFPTPVGGWTQHPDGSPIDPAAPNAGAGATQPAPATAQPSIVTVRTADGQIGQIPAANLQAAIARGATQIQ